MNTPTMTRSVKWYTPLRTIKSKGSQTKVEGGLLGTYAARQVHGGQFFTPNDVAAFMWRALGLDDIKADEWRKVHILDNSFGSGRLLQFADPGRHKLYGIEIDPAVAEQVRSAVQAAGFEFQLETGSMEDFRMERRSLDAAIINPPFSIHIDSPNVEPFECNAFGKFGERSATMSHRYAVAQALRWCRFVVALMPRSFVEEARNEAIFRDRLVAIFHLPAGIFEAEGANVDVSVLVWGEQRTEGPIIERTAEDLNKVRGLPVVKIEPGWHSTHATLTRVEENEGAAAITMPTTGDRHVRFAHNGRKLVLQFKCGAAQGRVMNTVLEDTIQGYRSRREHRLPKGVRFVGQGKLDLENYLAQGDPVASFAAFAQTIRAMGYEVEVDPAIPRYLARRHRRNQILKTPYGHAVNLADGGVSRWLADQPVLQGVCKKAFDIRESYWSSERPKVEKGQIVTIARDGDGIFLRSQAEPRSAYPRTASGPVQVSRVPKPPQ